MVRPIDPLADMILHGVGHDPRDCTTEAEMNEAVVDMMQRAREFDRHTESMRAGVPGVIAHLRRDIVRAQLAHLRRSIGG